MTLVEVSFERRKMGPTFRNQSGTGVLVSEHQRWLHITRWWAGDEAWEAWEWNEVQYVERIEPAGPPAPLG